jgi:uncharacterized integral membrane protein
MNNYWLKIKIWTKIVIVSLLVIYVILFIAQNSNQGVTVWLWFGHYPDTSAIVLILVTLLLGVVGTLLARVAIGTARQIRQMRERNRAQQLERKVADMEAMQSKASMLQTKPPASPPPEDKPTP